MMAAGVHNILKRCRDIEKTIRTIQCSTIQSKDFAAAGVTIRK